MSGSYDVVASTYGTKKFDIGRLIWVILCRAALYLVNRMLFNTEVQQNKITWNF